MSKYDKERKSLGISAVGSSSTATNSNTNSKYAADRQALFNPPQNKFNMDEMNSEKISMMRQDSNRIPALNMPKVEVKASSNKRTEPEKKQSEPLYKKIAREVLPETTDVLKFTPFNPLVTVGETLNQYGALPRQAREALRGVESGATLGLSEAQNKILGRDQAVEDARSQFGQYGQIAGSLIPGAAIERAAATAFRPAIQNLPKFAQLGITGATAGALDAAGQEVGDVAFRDSTFDPVNVALGAGFGGVGGSLAGGASDLLTKGKEMVLGPVIRDTVARDEAASILRNSRPNVGSPYSPEAARYNFIDQQVNPNIPLGLPDPLAGRGNVNRATAPDVIYGEGNIHTYALPEPSPQMAAREAHLNEAKSALSEVDAQIAALKGSRRKADREALAGLRQYRSTLAKSIDEFYNPTEATAIAPVRNRFATVGGNGQVNKLRSAAERLKDTQPQRSNVIDVPFSRVDETAATVQSVNLPRRTETPVQRPQQRGFINTLSSSENVSDEVRKGLEESSATAYTPITNAGTVEAANNRILKDIDAAEAFVLNSTKPSAEKVATGIRLIQELQNSGNVERAVTVAEKLARQLTEAGQTVQAASILNRLTPEGQLINLVRTAERNGKKVSTEDAAKFKQLAEIVQESSVSGKKANEFNSILNRLERGEKVSAEEINKLQDYLADASKTIQPKAPPVTDDMPKEFKDSRKRDKIISFLDDAEQAALERIKARRNRLNALPLDEWADHMIVVAAQIAKGTIKAATHVEDMVRMFGEEIRPVASEVFKKAQSMVTGVSRSASEGNLQKSQEILRKLSGEAQKEKAMVQATAEHVKKLIADAKAGKLNPDDIQRLRDYSDEIADILENKPKSPRIPTQEERFLQTVKSLAKKIAQVETEKVAPDQATREVSSLLRQVAKLADEGGDKLKAEPLDTKALSDIAHDVLNKTRPTPKPTTLQEKIVEKYIKENPKVTQQDIDTLRQLAKDVTRLSGTSKIEADIAMQKILNRYEKSSAWDKVQALRYIGMLLNTHTQMINAASGPIMSVTGTIADLFGTMIDIGLNKFLKQPRTTTLYGTNPVRFLAEYMKNLKIGARAGAVGANPAGIQGTNEIRGLAFKSLYNPLGLAERALGAVSKGADYATYKTVFDSEIRKQAYLSARNQGIKGKANIDYHIREFVNDPPEEAVVQADRIAKNTTFQRSDTTGGKVANFLNSAPPLVKPGVNAVFPFVRTPINIASTAVTMTPAGIIKGLYQLTRPDLASRREAIRTLSLGLTGTGIGAVGYYLMDIGIITGANDSGDKDVDNIREQAGKGKYRFNTSALKRYLEALVNGEGPEAAERAAKYREGDEQFDYNKLQPLAFPLAAGASIAEHKDVAKAGADAFGSLWGMSTLRGVQTVFQPSYGGTQGDKALGPVERVGESFLKSFSPSLLAQEARRQDPIQRKTPFNDGIIANTRDYFKSRTPWGISESLQPRKTTLGQDYKNAPGIKGSYLNPFRSEVAPYNKAAEIITGLIERTGDMKLAPSAPEKTVSGKNRSGERVTITIPPERYTKLQEDIGDEIISKIVALPPMDDERLSARIEKIYADVREKEMNKVKKELGIRISN